MRNTIVASVALATAISLTAPAHAVAISYASTTIDWSQFTTTITAYTGQYSIPIAEANLNGFQAPQVRNDLRSWGDVSALNELTNTKGYGNTTAGTVYAEGQALADGVSSITSHASAFVGRGGYFTLASQGSLNFSVPFSYTHALTFGSPTDVGYAQSTLFLWLGYADGTSIASRIIDFYDTGSGGSWSGSGQLTFAAPIALQPGDYAFDISAFAAAFARTEAVVPEPGTLALLSLGLAGLAATRRRKQ